MPQKPNERKNPSKWNLSQIARTSWPRKGSGALLSLRHLLCQSGSRKDLLTPCSVLFPLPHYSPSLLGLGEDSGQLRPSVSKGEPCREGLGAAGGSGERGEGSTVPRLWAVRGEAERRGPGRQQQPRTGVGVGQERRVGRMGHLQGDPAPGL